MALSATLHVFTITLANVDRATYADFELRVARHPSETAEFMLMRTLAYCLEYEDGISLTDGVSAVDEPAVLVRDLTGRITAWIEVGAPDAERLHRGAKLADRTALYTHRDVGQLLPLYAGRRIHQAEAIPVHAFAKDFVAAAAKALQRRSKLSVSLTEGELYLDVDAASFSTTVATHRLA